MTRVKENDDHEDYFGLLPLYVNNSLGKVKMLAVKKHLNNCVECQTELAFERSLQESISANEIDVTEISQRNLMNFNAQLDRRLAEKSQAETSIAKSDFPVQGNHASGNPLIERIFDYGRTLLTNGTTVGGALALGCCAVVVVSVLSRSINGGETQSPLRGCEHVVKQHELRVVTTKINSVTGSAKDILKEYFPGSNFTVEVLGDREVVVNITGDTCMVPLLVNDLEKLPSVNSVTVK